MNSTRLQRYIVKLSTIVASIAFVAMPISASALMGHGGDNTATTAANASSASAETTHKAISASDKSKIDLIHTRGSNEVDRRLTTLNGLVAKVNAASYLTSGQKATLVDELTNQINGLQTVKTELSSESDVLAARDDAQKIITDYRVYALTVPKVQIVLTADRQQIIETKLLTLAAKLQTSLDTAKAAGTDTTSLQAKLNDMNVKIKEAQGISSSVEMAVLPLQASDYNSDHTLLKGYRDQLKSARSSIGVAVNDGKAIVKNLKNE